MVALEECEIASICTFKNGSSISKVRFWLAALLLFSFLSYSAESSRSDIDISIMMDDDSLVETNDDGEESQTKTFLRKRNSIGVDASVTLSEHERKLAAGARIVVRYNSNRGYELAQECASEIIWDMEEPSGKVKGDDVEGRNNPFEGGATNPPTAEDRSGQLIFVADEECMLFLQRQTRDVLWVDYDHPTKLLDDDGSSSWLDWWMDSFTSREGKPRKDHSYDNTPTESKRNLEEEQYSQWAMSLIQADRVSKGNRTTKVCIVDTGINREHPVFDGISISGINSRWQWDQDNNGHGTRVAGVIAGFNKQDLGGSGEIELYITRASGDDGVGYEIDLYIAIEQCVQAGVDVINVSNGSTGLSTYNNFLYQRVVNDHGILLIAAVGNDGDDTKHFPASHPAAIAVSSVDRNGDFSPFSNNGNWVDLAAPGAGIVGPTSTTTSGYAYSSVSGTSFASPFVTGAVAILRTHYDPMVCPSEAIRYALAINAVVPGAPVTGINGNNMNPLLIPSPGITMKHDDNADQFDSVGNGDREVEGKCNNQYGNGLIKTRDALEWLSFYDCFSPVLLALQDGNKVMASTTKALPVESTFASVGSNYDEEEEEEYDDDDDDGDGSWAPRDQSDQNEDNDENKNETKNQNTSFDIDHERWAPLFQSEIGEETNNNNNINNNNNNNDEGSGNNENEPAINEAMHATSLQQMLPWNDPRVGGCYSGRI